MTTQSNINLNTCVRGQKVKLRDGICVEYVRKSKDSTSDYPHVAGGETYTDDGYFRLSKTEDEWDIVKILPLKSPMTTQSNPELTHSITDQIDVTNPDHVSIIPHEHGVTISIKKGLTTISWRHYNS
jgi:hypothetical protein